MSGCRQPGMAGQYHQQVGDSPALGQNRKQQTGQRQGTSQRSRTGSPNMRGHDSTSTTRQNPPHCTPLLDETLNDSRGLGKILDTKSYLLQCRFCCNGHNCCPKDSTLGISAAISYPFAELQASRKECRSGKFSGNFPAGRGKTPVWTGENRHQKRLCGRFTRAAANRRSL